MYIRCPDTDHTKVGDGKVAGFDLSKAIPYDDSLFTRIVKNKGSLADNEKVAKQNLPSMRGKLQKMLNDIENGKKPTYGTNIYKDIEIKNECVALLKSPNQKPKTQTNKPSTNTRVDNHINDNYADNHTDDYTTNNYLRDFNKATSKDEKAEIATKFKEANPKFLAKIKNNIALKPNNSKETINNKDNSTNNKTP